MKKLIFALMIVLVFGANAWASDQQTDMASQKNSAASQAKTSASYGQDPLIADAAIDEDRSGENWPESTKHDAIHRIIFYIPNRILDLLDIVRLRVRVGPGLAVGARVTEPFSVFVGGYESVYAGLPGPRLRPIVKPPVGLEDNQGIGVSIFDLTFDAGYGPDYSQTEIGASFQALIVGVDVDVDPIEILDFALGLVFIDIRGDDL